MARLPTRSKLEAMKRVDIQRLCKDYGVKANLKTEALIELLLGVSQPQPPKPVPVQPQRSVSTRRTSSRHKPRVRSGGSMIVHESDSEPVEAETPAADSQPQPARRTRKVKDLQKRLGVGRPVVAGGSGARAVTRASSSTSKAKRAKSNRNLRSTQLVIPEEDVPIVPSLQSPSNDPSQPGPSGSQRSHSRASSVPPVPSEPSDEDPKENADCDAVSSPSRPSAPNPGPLTTNAIDSESQLPLILRMQQQIQTLASEVDVLRGQVASIASLRAEIAQLKLVVDRSAHKPRSLPAPALSPTPMSRSRSPVKLPSSNPQSSSSTLAPPDSTAASGGPRRSPRHITTPSALGKRSRSSNSSPTDTPEGRDDVANEREVRPLKKRLKTIAEGADDGEIEETTQTGPATQEQQDDDELNPLPQARFSIFRGPSAQQVSFDDPPPPTNHLPDFFTGSSPRSPGTLNTLLLPQAGQGRPTTSTARASENQHPFMFSFLPLEASPAPPLLNPMPGFPVPEPPESPSPAGQDSVLRSGEGAFQPFGFPPPARPRSGASFGGLGFGSGSGPIQARTVTQDGSHAFVNPALLSSTSKDILAMGDDGGGNEGVLSKRTMYGTELEGDTRFGEFGVEGVGSGGVGFWATGGRY